MKYIKNGEIYSQVNTIELDGQVIFNPSHENILKAGYEVYVAPEPTEEELLQLQNAEKIAELEGNIADKETDFMKALETWLSANATGEVKEIADERLALRAKINAIGKTEIVEGGDGSEEKPFVFEDATNLIPNAFYTYNGKKYVYMGVAQAKTTWADVENVMGEWY